MKTCGKVMDHREFLRGLGTTAMGAVAMLIQAGGPGEVKFAAPSLEPRPVKAAPPFFTV